MMLLRGKFLVLALLVSMLAALVATAQSGRTTPRPRASDDDTERIVTEEIKVNVTALDYSGKFFKGVRKEDLVINEDGVLHQATSVRRIPATVLIVLDTGGEDRQAKDFKTTQMAAMKLIDGLQKEDTVAVVEYNDDARIVVEWSANKDLLKEALQKNLKFGRRSEFVKALEFASQFFQKANVENRHLVLITDGLDSGSDQKARTDAIRKLLSTDINVHILSYTKMEQIVVAQRYRSVQGGGKKSKPLPPGAEIPGSGQTVTVPIMTANLDRAMIRKIRERGESLAKSEKELSDLAQNTNGMLLLPETRLELIEKTEVIASNIDANYVVTYIPKRPLADVRNAEERNIEITSRRQGLDVLAKRKLLVEPEKR